MTDSVERSGSSAWGGSVPLVTHSPRPNGRRRRIADRRTTRLCRRPLVGALIVLSSLVSPAFGFICLRTEGGSCLHWAEGQTLLRSFLGNPGGPLINGTLTWDQNVLAAANDWNTVGAGFRFSVTFGGQMADPCACRSTGATGDNPVMFARSACDAEFGDIVALTQSCFDQQSGAVSTSAVLMNSSVAWNAYDGPLQLPVNDLRRVLVHEFGHVLGLAHPDDNGQVVVAIMNTRESDIDRLTGDDIGGIFSIYPNTPAARCVGDCDGDDEVTIDEILRLVGMALGLTPLEECPVGDANGSGSIEIDEVLTAVNNLLNGCVPPPQAADIDVGIGTGAPSSTAKIP